MSALGLDLTKNLSYFAVPAAFLVGLLPHSIFVVGQGPKCYNNANPRGFKDHLEKDADMDKPTKERIMRAKYSTENAFETLGFFTGAVVAANQTGVDVDVLNKLSWGYVASRVAYTLIYVVLQRNKRWAPARSLAWIVGIGISFALWVMAGKQHLK